MNHEFVEAKLHHQVEGFEARLSTIGSFFNAYFSKCELIYIFLRPAPKVNFWQDCERGIVKAGC